MSTARGRMWPTFGPAVFAGALVVYAAGVPLGLARVETAPEVAAGLALDGGSRPAVLSALAIQVARFIPLGDLPFRANLASAVCVALAMAFLGRLCLETASLLRPPAHARQDSRDFMHEPIAAAGTSLAALLSMATFDTATSGGNGAAVLALLTAAFLSAFLLLRDTDERTSGLLLACLTGVSVRADGLAGSLLWPPFLGLALWSLRKGARWPLLAPFCFVLGWGAALLGQVALGGKGAPWLVGAAGVSLLRWDGLLSSAVELGDGVGIVAVLLAAMGMVALASRAAVPAAWLVLILVFTLPSVHRGQGGAAPLALPVAIAVTEVLACAGLLHVAGRLGRARMAAAFALAVIVALSPALDGGSKRWHKRVPAMHLLDRALERADIRSTVTPGSTAIEGLFRLARTLGLRPDLDLELAAITRRGGPPEATDAVPRPSPAASPAHSPTASSAPAPHTY